MVDRGQVSQKTRLQISRMLGWRYPATYPPQTLFPALQWLVRMTESRMLRRDAVSLVDNERIVLYAVGMGVGWNRFDGY